MTREELIEKIENIAKKYCQDNILNLQQMHLAISTAFEAGAKWVEKHPANPWHNVADGDLPKEYKGDAICPTFLVAAKGGNLIMAYYAWKEDEDEPYFYDDCDMALDVEWWVEIPKLPSE